VVVVGAAAVEVPGPWAVVAGGDEAGPPPDDAKAGVDPQAVTVATTASIAVLVASRVERVEPPIIHPPPTYRT
jgi:hypothetical protein